MTSDGAASSHRKKENGELSRRRLLVVNLFGKRKTLFRLIHTSFRGTIEQVIPVVPLFKLGQFESQKKETNPGYGTVTTASTCYEASATASTSTQVRSEKSCRTAARWSIPSSFAGYRAEVSPHVAACSSVA
jgi:hypothetical protein